MAHMNPFFLLFLLIPIPIICTGIDTIAGDKRDDEDTKTREVIKRLTHKDNMNAELRPHVSGPPTKVKIGFYVLTLGSIDEVQMEYTADIYFRMKWSDPRLVFTEIKDDLVIEASLIHTIWTPDIYFPNVKYAELHDVIVPNRALTIAPDGNCTYSIRITMVVACPMDLTNFPMDRQQCALKLESYSHTLRHMTMEWISDKPIEIDEEMELPEMTLEDVVFGSCEKNYSYFGRYPCLTATFVLKRSFGYFILQTFIPTILIVVLSWVSFWINIDAVPARISLGVTTVLTMTTQLSGSKGSIPKISYPKAIDVWMSVCMMFVFTALLEFAFVNALTRRNKQVKEDGKENVKLSRTSSTEDIDNRSDRDHKVKCNFSKCINDRQAAILLDKISRVVFPATFFLFNGIFWGVYLS